MECPVCKSTNLSQENLHCPKCSSDLEALHLAGAVKKENRNMKSFAAIISVLMLMVLLGWIFSAFNSSHDKDAVPLSDFELIKADLASANEEKLIMSAELDDLRKQLSALQQAGEKRSVEYIIREGESLFLIARKVYGNGFRYTDIAKANRIDDPGKISAGQKLIIHY